MKAAPGPSFAEAFRFWLKLGFISFGGPTGQIAITHEELVEKRGWISEARFLHVGIVAGSLFVLPSALILWGLSYAYVIFGTLPAAVGLLSGLKLALLAIVAAATVRIGKKMLGNGLMVALAVVAFGLIYGGVVPFPLVVAGAGTIGWLGGRQFPAKFLNPVTSGVAEGSCAEACEAQLTKQEGLKRLSRGLKTAGAGVLCWWIPVLGIGAWLGWKHTVFSEALFVSKAAVVTFGGAYAVLPYVAQEAVGNYGWLAQGQMLDGLGLAETTPGPLIMVLQFVGFVGAWQHPMGLPPLAAATLGAAVTTWVTFVSCFLWIFRGAPYVEQLRSHRGLSASLAAISAAVVGVIASMALHFGAVVLFPGHWAVDWSGVALVLVGFAGLVRWKWGVIPVILAGAAIGLARHFTGL